MKIQALFSLKDKSQKSKCRLLQFLIGTLRVKYIVLGHLKTFYFPFGTNGKLTVLGVPLLKHIRVLTHTNF